MTLWAPHQETQLSVDTSGTEVVVSWAYHTRTAFARRQLACSVLFFLERKGCGQAPWLSCPLQARIWGSIINEGGGSQRHEGWLEARSRGAFQNAATARASQEGGVHVTALQRPSRTVQFIYFPAGEEARDPVEVAVILGTPLGLAQRKPRLFLLMLAAAATLVPEATRE